MSQTAFLAPAPNPKRPDIPAAMAAELVDPKVHASQRIHDIFTWLRANEPLGIARPDGFDPFWVVTRYEDLRTISLLPNLFHNGDKSIVLIDRAAEDHMAELLNGRRFPIRTILNMDDPDHARYRGLTADKFQPKHLLAMSNSMRATARDFVNRMFATGGECDFTETVAFLYPLRVVMGVIGVPAEDEPTILRLTQEFFGTGDADFARPESAENGGAALSAVVDEFNAYFDALLAARRQSPRDDVVSLIANATINGKPIPELEARSYCAHLATAGHETTSSVTAAGMLALCREPGLLATLKANRVLLPAFIEEAARFGTPSKILMRAAAQDIEICGRAFRAGDWIALAYASANRDEDMVEDPERFRIDRRPIKHISFGYGPHICLGQNLARIEMRILFEEILDRLDSVELAGDPKTMESLMVSGLKNLPIRFTGH